MAGSWKNAFAIDKERERTFTEEEADLCRRIAKKIVGHGLGLPGILFFESAKPMNFIGSQVLAFFEPLVRGIFSWKDYTRFRILLERRGSMELLLSAIERAEAERSAGAAAARAACRPGFFIRTWRRLKKRVDRQ